MLNKLERCYSHYSISQTTKQIKTFVECMIHMPTESTYCFSSSRLVFCSWVGLISFDLTFFLRNQARRKILGNWHGINVTNLLIVANLRYREFRAPFL